MGLELESRIDVEGIEGVSHWLLYLLVVWYFCSLLMAMNIEQYIYCLRMLKVEKATHFWGKKFNFSIVNRLFASSTGKLDLDRRKSGIFMLQHLMVTVFLIGIAKILSNTWKSVRQLLHCFLWWSFDYQDIGYLCLLGFQFDCFLSF